MRPVHIPTPTNVWGVTCEGPVASAAPSANAAYAMLDEALMAVPALDAELGDEGWCVLWRAEARFEAGPLVRAFLWVRRSDHGRELATKLKEPLERARFIVRVHPHLSDAHHGLAPRVVYLRAGSVRLGLDLRTPALLPEVEVVEEDRANVDFGQHFRYRAQPCPACHVVDHPAQLIAGFPSAELLLAATLGEVVLAGCNPGDVPPGANARCRRCGADFVAR
jgi:hypothetical protein